MCITVSRLWDRSIWVTLERIFFCGRLFKVSEDSLNKRVFDSPLSAGKYEELSCLALTSYFWVIQLY